VPFFLYSGGDFDVFWNSCQKKIFAKGVEVSFLLHLQDHPWRTRDPEEAAVFVIPGLFSVALNSHHNDSNCDLSVEEMSTTLASAVQESSWFNRHQGRDHLMVVGYFMAELFLSQSIEWNRLLKHATLALHSGVRMYIGKQYPRCIISVGHQSSPNENSDVAVKTRSDLLHMRPLKQGLLDLQAENSLKPQRRSIFMLGQANKMRYYRHRVTAVKKLGDVGVNSFIAASKCEKGMKFKSCGVNRIRGVGGDNAVTSGNIDDAPVAPVTNCCLKNKLSYSSFLKQMMLSNFSLLIGGGDPGSSRFADALVLSVPQLILSDGFYERYAPFPCIVPWRQITEQISEKDFQRQPKQAVEKALTRATERRESMIRLQQQYVSDVDWTHPHTLAPNNLLVETVRKCFIGTGLERKSAVVDRVMKGTKKVKCFPT
jgi:hypothetical protein